MNEHTSKQAFGQGQQVKSASGQGQQANTNANVCGKKPNEQHTHDQTNKRTNESTCEQDETRPAEQRQVRAAVPSHEQGRGEHGGPRSQKQRTPPSALAVPPHMHLGCQDGGPSPPLRRCCPDPIGPMWPPLLPQPQRAKAAPTASFPENKEQGGKSMFAYTAAPCNSPPS